MEAQAREGGLQHEPPPQTNVVAGDKLCGDS